MRSKNSLSPTIPHYKTARLKEISFSPEKYSKNGILLLNSNKFTLNIIANKRINNEKVSINILKKEYNLYEEGEFSSKKIGVVKSYAFNSYFGLSNHENEDRIAVSPQVKCPNKTSANIWPKISYFALFDGHSGDRCSTFLRNNLLSFIIEDKNFPVDVKAALIGAFERAENEFNSLNEGKARNEIEKSGSCAIVVLIVEKLIYVANLGDSRAIISMEEGKKIKPISIDHKPNNPKEFERINKCGGKVYLDNDDNEDIKDISKLTFINKVQDFEKYALNNDVIYREYPSSLAVVRTIGDYAAKSKEFGGVKGSILSIPDIFVFESSSFYDFILIGCDGIFDMCENEEIISAAWQTVKKRAKERNNDIHLLTLDLCNMTIKNAMNKKSMDNLSCIVVGLDGLEKYVNSLNFKTKRLNNKINIPW